MSAASTAVAEAAYDLAVHAHICTLLREQKALRVTRSADTVKPDPSATIEAFTHTKEA